MFRPPPWTRAEPSEPPERIEPSADEARNGWTAETLTAYVAESRARQNVSIAAGIGGRKRKPTKTNGHRWGFPAR